MKNYFLFLLFVFISQFTFSSLIFGNDIILPNNFILNNSLFNSKSSIFILENDSSCQKNNFKSFNFEINIPKLENYIADSLLYKFKYDIDKYFDKEFWKEFEDNMNKYWEKLPKLDKQKLDEFLKDFESKAKQDSLFKKFKFYKRNDIFEKSDIIEI